MSSPGARTDAATAQLPPHDPIAANDDSCTPVAPPMSARPGLVALLKAALVTGITAGLISLLFYGIGSLFGTDFDVLPYGGEVDDELQHVQWWMAAVVPVFAALVYALASGLLLNRRHNRRIAVIAGYLVGLASLALPLLQTEATWPTKVWLALMHLVTILLVVPNVARVLGDSDPYVTAGYRRTGVSPV